MALGIGGGMISTFGALVGGVMVLIGFAFMFMGTVVLGTLGGMVLACVLAKIIGQDPLNFLPFGTLIGLITGVVWAVRVIKRSARRLQGQPKQESTNISPCPQIDAEIRRLRFQRQNIEVELAKKLALI